MEQGSPSCLQAPVSDHCSGQNESGAHLLILFLQGASCYQDTFGLPSAASYAPRSKLDGILKTFYN